MRTAMPFLTCRKMRAFLPSATTLDISMPRLIGPGCKTMTSGFNPASRFSSKPKRVKYSAADSPVSSAFNRSRCTRNSATTSTPLMPSAMSLMTVAPVHLVILAGKGTAGRPNEYPWHPVCEKYAGRNGRHENVKHRRQWRWISRKNLLPPALAGYRRPSAPESDGRFRRLRR